MSVDEHMKERYGAEPVGGASNSEDLLWTFCGPSVDLLWTFCVYASDGKRYVVMTGEKDTDWQVFKPAEHVR